MKRRTFCATAVSIAGVAFGIVPKRTHRVHVFCPMKLRTGLCIPLELSQRQLDLGPVTEYIQSVRGCGRVIRDDTPIARFPYPSKDYLFVRSTNHATDLIEDGHVLSGMSLDKYHAIPILPVELDENDSVEFSGPLAGTDHTTVHVVGVTTIIKVNGVTPWEFELTQQQIDIPEVTDFVGKKRGPGLLLRHPPMWPHWGHYVTFRNHDKDFERKEVGPTEIDDNPPPLNIDINDSELEGYETALASNIAADPHA